MSNYVACHFGAETSRMYLASLQDSQLTLSEVRRFHSRIVRDKNSVQWDIQGLYHEVLEGLRSVEAVDEPVDGISCSSTGADYLVFQADGTVLTPAYHQTDPRSAAGRKDTLHFVNESVLYQATGMQPRAGSTLYQLAAETKRIKNASFLLPIGDAFNYLLSGVARAERSLAATTQLLDPLSGDWSGKVLSVLRVPSKLLPTLVEAGTTLGPLRSEISRHNSFLDTRVVATCSHELAQAISGLPLGQGQNWAYVQPGLRGLIGTVLAAPVIDSSTESLGFNNQVGARGAFYFYKETPGLWILEECKRYWRENNSELEGDLLGHLASSAPPFVSLIDPANPMFSEPGDMVLKIQAYCRDTRQTVPRKPGPVYRCILESLALHCRRALSDLQTVSGKRMDRLCIFGSGSSTLYNYFLANAVNIPTVVCMTDAAAVGSAITQAMALGHIQTSQQAAEIVQSSFKITPIFPQGKAWQEAYGRFLLLGQTEQMKVA